MLNKVYSDHFIQLMERLINQQKNGEVADTTLEQLQGCLEDFESDSSDTIDDFMEVMQVAGLFDFVDQDEEQTIETKILARFCGLRAVEILDLLDIETRNTLFSNANLNLPHKDDDTPYVDDEGEETYSEGCSILFHLASNNILSKENGSSVAAYLTPAGVKAGPENDAHPMYGTNALYWLCNSQKGLALLAALEPEVLNALFTPETVKAGPLHPNHSDYGQNVLYVLCMTQQGRALLSTLEPGVRNALFTRETVKAGPRNGLGRGQNVLTWLSEHLDGIALLTSLEPSVRNALFTPETVKACSLYKESLSYGESVLYRLCARPEGRALLASLEPSVRNALFTPETVKVGPLHKESLCYGESVLYRLCVTQDGRALLASLEPEVLNALFTPETVKAGTFHKDAPCYGENVLYELSVTPEGRAILASLEPGVRNALFTPETVKTGPLNQASLCYGENVLSWLCVTPDGCNLLTDLEPRRLNALFTPETLKAIDLNEKKEGVLSKLLQSPTLSEWLASLDNELLDSMITSDVIKSYVDKTTIKNFSNLTRNCFAIHTLSRLCIETLTVLFNSDKMDVRSIDLQTGILFRSPFENIIGAPHGVELIKKYPRLLIKPSQHYHYNVAICQNDEGLLLFLALMGADISTLSPVKRQQVDTAKRAFWTLLDSEVEKIIDLSINYGIPDEIQQKMINHRIFDVEYPQLGFLKHCVKDLFNIRNLHLNLDQPKHKLAMLAIGEYRKFHPELSLETINVCRKMMKECLEGCNALSNELIVSNHAFRQALIGAIARCQPLNPDTINSLIVSTMNQFMVQPQQVNTRPITDFFKRSSSKRKREVDESEMIDRNMVPRLER